MHTNFKTQMTDPTRPIMCCPAPNRFKSNTKDPIRPILRCPAPNRFKSNTKSLPLAAIPFLDDPDLKSSSAAAKKRATSVYAQSLSFGSARQSSGGSARKSGQGSRPPLPNPKTAVQKTATAAAHKCRRCGGDRCLSCNNKQPQGHRPARCTRVGNRVIPWPSDRAEAPGLGVVPHTH